MTAPPNVLLFGRDPYLAETRRLILCRAGFSVRSASAVTEFEAEGAKAPPHVIVLCHTLSLAECALAFEIAITRWPRAKRLVLTSGSQTIPVRLLDDAMEAADGPAKLVGRVSHLAAVEDVAQKGRLEACR